MRSSIIGLICGALALVVAIYAALLTANVRDENLCGFVAIVFGAIAIVLATAALLLRRSTGAPQAIAIIAIVVGVFGSLLGFGSAISNDKPGLGMPSYGGG